MKRFFQKIIRPYKQIRAVQTQKENIEKNDLPKIEQDNSEDIYSADNPINNPNLDEFNRREFSERIAKTIAARKDTKSLVIGIYGKWGGGKTTVLKFIEGELNNHKNVATLSFNPWLFPSDTELLIAFYSELAKVMGKSISTKKEDAGKFIKEYVSAIAGFFDRKEAVEKIGGFLSDVRLEELRDRIGKFLVAHEKFIVVLMDDIDRLDKDEIHAVFRLIKLSANFENLIYVLAFDRDVVEMALSERYPGKEENPGQNFLEKIVQVPINLPKLPKSDLRRFCYKQVEKALQVNNMEISENEVQEFTRGFVSGIEIRLETPRMAIRYANMLNFSLPLVKGEVHIAEFLLIESIRAFYPKAYEIIKVNQDVFTAISLAGMNAYPSEKEEIKKIAETTFIDLSDEEKSNLKQLLIILFPRLKTVFENTIYGSEWDKTWAEEKRISSHKYFDRYFTYSIPTGDVSDVQIEKFINSLDDIEMKELVRVLARSVSEQDAETFISKLHQKIEKITSTGQTKLAIGLSLFGNIFPNPKELFGFRTPFSRGALLIARLIEIQSTNETKLELALQVVEIAEPISFALEIVRWFRTKKSDADGEIINPDGIQTISVALANRIEILAIEDLVFFDKYPDHALSLILFWSKFGTKENADKYLTAFLNANLLNVHKLLNATVPIAYPMDGSLPHKGEFERDQYNYLQSFVNIDLISSHLTVLFQA